MQINFYLRDKNRPTTHVQMYVSIAPKTKVVKHSINETVQTANWDFEKQRLKARATEARNTNAVINYYERRADEYVRDYRATHNAFPKGEQLKAFLENIYSENAEGKAVPSFVSFVNTLIETRGKDPERYGKGTIFLYKRVLRYLTEFVDVSHQHNQLEWQKIDTGFCLDWIQYLLSRKYSNNTVSSLWAKFKMFIKEGGLEGYIDAGFLQRNVFARGFTDSDAIALDAHEVEDIKQLQFESDRIERHKDAFVMNCHLGLRCSDYEKISAKDIITQAGHRMLFRKTGKTKAYVYIPLSDTVEEILQKYGGEFPKITNNIKWNADLKLICAAAGINRPTVKTTNIGGKDVEKTYKKWELVTVHTSRRTFATLLYDHGTDLLSISSLLSHANTNTTRKYIKDSSRGRAVKMATSGFFKSKDDAEKKNLA